jgi:hypothetical protein
MYTLDLVDEMQWEDVVEFITLEDAGVEECGHHADGDSGVCQYVAWFYDNECSEYESN